MQISAGVWQSKSHKGRGLVSHRTCRCLTMFNNVGLRYIKLSRCAPQKQDCDLQGMQPLLMLFITSLFDTVRSTGNEG